MTSTSAERWKSITPSETVSVVWVKGAGDTGYGGEIV